MPKTKSTHDVFTAIAEPKRRALIEKLIISEMTVNDLVDAMQWPQPMVSKHLGVLKEVKIVTERKEGRYRFYRIQAEQLRPIQQWIHQFEKYWGGTLNQLDTYLTNIQTKQNDIKKRTKP